ncbi:histidine phosphatase family protein [Sulfitobacter aestuarii]|uniref:Histidine phosphatase family protein n=1 Tax=Sulfitobacter aestuarii TaxID=2161676 RepID=A0ABW5U9A7_9RHOB
MRACPPLYILRHGETEWNVQNRLQGCFDSPLTARGEEQALAQRAILQSCGLRGYRALSSPQRRARHTAELALEGLVAPIGTDAALSEIGVGDWAGELRAELLLRHPEARDAFDLYEHAPNGEGFAALRTRCEAFLAGIDTPTILVTHGITSRMLRLILTGRPTRDLREIEGGQGVVFALRDGQQRQLTGRG